MSMNLDNNLIVTVAKKGDWGNKIVRPMNISCKCIEKRNIQLAMQLNTLRRKDKLQGISTITYVHQLLALENTRHHHSPPSNPKNKFTSRAHLLFNNPTRLKRDNKDNSQ